MADTDQVPDDGITAGSRTTPQNVPPMRQAAATARELLTRFAAKQWQVDAGALEVRDGTITHAATHQKLTYADLAKSKEMAEAFQQPVESDIALTPVGDWNVMGSPVPRPNSRDLVTGAHRFPSDIVRPDMLYGRVLRQPSYGAMLESIDLSAAQAMQDVVVVREGEFVGFAAPTLYQATAALEAVAKTASWKTDHSSVQQDDPRVSQGTRPAGPGAAQYARIDWRRAWPRRPRLSARPTRWPIFSTRRWSRVRPSPSGTTAS